MQTTRLHTLYRVNKSTLHYAYYAFSLLQGFKRTVRTFSGIIFSLHDYNNRLINYLLLYQPKAETNNVVYSNKYLNQPGVEKLLMFWLLSPPTARSVVNMYRVYIHIISYFINFTNKTKLCIGTRTKNLNYIPFIILYFLHNFETPYVIICWG